MGDGVSRDCACAACENQRKGLVIDTGCGSCGAKDAELSALRARVGELERIHREIAEELTGDSRFGSLVEYMFYGPLRAAEDRMADLERLLTKAVQYVRISMMAGVNPAAAMLEREICKALDAAKGGRNA